MDFSWVKQLAEDANSKELSRLEIERLKKEEQGILAQATLPFIEKLFMLISTFTDEFNKHCMFENLRVLVSKFQRRSKGVNSQGVKDSSEEIAYFTFTRRNWMYGIRGFNGTVEFVEFPVTEGAGSLNIKLDELGLSPSYRLVGKVDSTTKNVTWSLDDTLMDGTKIISLCQHYFSDFIERTTE